jgi:hypothetical protein
MELRASLYRWSVPDDGNALPADLNMPERVTRVNGDAN